MQADDRVDLVIALRNGYTLTGERVPQSDAAKVMDVWLEWRKGDLEDKKTLSLNGLLCVAMEEIAGMCLSSGTERLMTEVMGRMARDAEEKTKLMKSPPKIPGDEWKEE